MGEPDSVRAAAERKRAQDEADRVMQEKFQAKIDAAAENAKKIQFRNPDGSFQQR